MIRKEGDGYHLYTGFIYVTNLDIQRKKFSGQKAIRGILVMAKVHHQPSFQVYRHDI